MPVREAWVDQEEGAWLAAEAAVDLIFLVDVVFSFFSAFYNRVEVLVSSPR